MAPKEEIISSYPRVRAPARRRLDLDDAGDQTPLLNTRRIARMQDQYLRRRAIALVYRNLQDNNSSS